VRTKRAFDLLAAAIGLVLSIPAWLVAAAAIKLTSSGPVLHRATRVGRDGDLFTVLKFRTMRIGAEDTGPGITSAGDPRVTPIGRILRRLKMDELPQLVNVLQGEMSMVGPRPEDPRYVEHYTERQRQVLSVLPGLTSPAALAYRDEERLIGGQTADVETIYLTRIMPAKLALDLAYVDNRTIWLDLRVLGRTAAGVFVRPRRRSE
jgi:lipopolysaccharide/colanic/teichoic acid biosynthesis glycosyltransferase